jgi:hypothetical protein
MKPHHLLLTFSAACSLCCLAQDIPASTPAQVAPEPAGDTTSTSDNSPGAATAEIPPTDQPSATTPTTAPENTNPVTAPPKPDLPPEVPTTPATAGTESATESQPSLTVQVEKLQNGNDTIDPKTVKLLSPFPAKPLATVPPGWRLEPTSSAPPFIRIVDLAPGASITLNIRPHLLVPNSDGASAFSITEPGFDPALGYRQAHTISAILATSIQQLDEDAKQLGNTIDQLQQLISSLPKPALAPSPTPTPMPTPKPPPPTPGRSTKQSNKS